MILLPFVTFFVFRINLFWKSSHVVRKHTRILPVKLVDRTNEVKNVSILKRTKKLEFFLIEFYRITKICRICRILFLVIFIFIITKNSILEVL